MKYGYNTITQTNTRMTPLHLDLKGIYLGKIATFYNFFLDVFQRKMERLEPVDLEN